MTQMQVSLAEGYRRVRNATERLREPLCEEDCAAQSMADASPVKWHLAHTSWFFETFVLEREDPNHRPINPSFRVLFNSYYNTVGEQYERPQRGLLTRPTLDDVLSYRNVVDEKMHEFLDEPKRLNDEAQEVVEIGLHHEQQHQELILTDVKHLFSCNPLWPAYHEGKQLPTQDSPRLGWFRVDEGLHRIGHTGEGFAYDNEQPRHRVFLNAFELATRLTTSGEFLSFIEDDGYRRPELWLADGWTAASEQRWQAPLYWERRNGEWVHLTLSGARPICLDEPVCHVSFYEADAFARWAGARLPTEGEWEVASQDAAGDNFVERGVLHPVSAGREESGALQQMLGDVWEWTSSPYAPYPGFDPPEGALGEYNGKFMCNQMVLRGGSCATPQSHIRPTYRNFFYPDARWQFSGIRLARDAS